MSRASETLDKERDDLGRAIEIVQRLLKSSAMPENKCDLAVQMVRTLDDFIWITYQEMP